MTRQVTLPEINHFYDNGTISTLSAVTGYVGWKKITKATLKYFPALSPSFVRYCPTIVAILGAAIGAIDNSLLTLAVNCTLCFIFRKKSLSAAAAPYFLKDMTEEARQKPPQTYIGRKKKLGEATAILSSKNQRDSILFVGRTGIGKTTLVETLVSEMVHNSEHPLKSRRVFRLDQAAFMAGARFIGDFQQRVKDLLDFVEQNPDVIIFCDEIQGLIGLGRGGLEQTGADVPNLLREAMTRGLLQMIGATTPDEYDKFLIGANRPFARRFERIEVGAPSDKKCRKMIKALQTTFTNDYPCLTLSDEAIAIAVQLAPEYNNVSNLPDSAIGLVKATIRYAAKTRKISLGQAGPQVAIPLEDVVDVVFEKTESMRKANPAPDPLQQFVQFNLPIGRTSKTPHHRKVYH